MVLLSASVMSDVGHCQDNVQWMVNAILLISPKTSDLLSAQPMTQQEKTAHSFDAALALLAGESAAQKASLHS